MPDVNPAADTSRKALSIVLVGNPNVGKSVIFGYLTGKYVTVSNFPGTTVEISQGKMHLDDTAVTVTDTPGTNAFIPQSEDEKVTRDVLLEGKYEAVIQIADSKNLRRSLLMTIQLAEMGVPFILIQNMADEAKSRGISIDHALLAEIFGIPVLSTTATQGKGLPQIKRMLKRAAVSPFSFSYPSVIEDSIARITRYLPDTPISRRSVALMLLAGDASMTDWLSRNLPRDAIARISEIVHSAQVQADTPLYNMIAESRLEKIDELMRRVYAAAKHEKRSYAVNAGKWAMHPAWGIGVALLVLYATYWFVGLFGAGLIVDFLEKVVFSQYINPVSIRLFDLIAPFEHTHVREVVDWSLKIPLTSSHAIDTGLHLVREVITPAYTIPDGVSLSHFEQILKFFHDFLIGQYGIITMALAYSFAIVFPIVGTFFIIFSVLEDSGYLPRLAVMLNTVFKAIGLNGKAILPMVLGLGCDTMATMTTRIMETRKERIIVTLLLALGIPCSAQLGVLLGMMSSISLSATGVWLVVVAGVLILVGYLASKVMTGESSAFILEIPPIRKPQIGNILVKTIARMEWYFKEVVPLFILGTVVLFFLDISGALNVIRDVSSPLIMTFLGLPAETTEAFLIGFLRRDYGAVFLLDAAHQGLLSPNQILISMVTITLFVPCIANVFIIIKELGIRVALKITLFIFPFAFFVGGALNMMLRLFHINF